MLTLHRAERGDCLVEALAELLASPQADAMAPEVIAVPTHGIERWLAQQLSARLGTVAGRHDGVCANVEFPSPSSLVGDALAAATGSVAGDDPWLPERSAWALVEVVDANLGERWLQALAAHIGRAHIGPASAFEDERGGRRFGVVRHLAGLYDNYGVHRPTMVRAWAEGLDHDASGGPLRPDLSWQAILWRKLREHIGTPSPAERMPSACMRIEAHPEVLDLPARLSLFGLTRLPASHLDVLDAIAAGREVHLWLLHPSAPLWERIAALPAGQRHLGPRRHDTTATLAVNPLLAMWGRDAREMQLVLSSCPSSSLHHALPAEEPELLLARAQADIRQSHQPPGAPPPGGCDPRPILAPGDRSLQVHACHGRARQVEVLRDAILHAMADDLTLEPRDVIVMCPDIETFAPLVHATFGARPEAAASAGDPSAGDPSAGDPSAGDYGRELRVRLADRSLRQTNPVLAAVSKLLALGSSRVTASQVIDFVSTPPVRERFGFDDGEIARVSEWARAAGIRWGLDENHREPWLLGGVRDGTWRAGMKRLLLGATMSEDGWRLVGGTLPLDDVGSGDIDLAGRFAELVDRLGTTLASFAFSQPIEAWLAAIRGGADALMTAVRGCDWQVGQLHELLASVLDEATEQRAGPSGALMSLAEVQALLADHLRGRPTRANFRTGQLTVCTLVPMRSVPHRVVCLLGLDDGAFPRQPTPDGDDLISRDPWTGDRDARSEDRQLLLDALLAAKERLIITYTARDERTNAPVPPAVPLGELLDTIDATVRTGRPGNDGAELAARRLVVTEHPLQPFNPRNFMTGELVAGCEWGFDREGLGAAVALTGPRDGAPAFLEEPLPIIEAPVIELGELIRFLQHPAKAFLRQRLGVVLAGGDNEPADALAIELDGLERWALGTRLLDGRLAGVGADVAIAAERARGELPPGALGDQALEQVLPVVERLVIAAATITGATGPDGIGAGTGSSTASGSSTSAQPPIAGTIDARAELPGERAVVGTVGGITGDTLQSVTFSRLAAKHRLAAWARLLLVSAALPERPWRAVTIGRGNGERTEARITGPLAGSPEQRRKLAIEYLGSLVDLYDRGSAEPLPLYCATSAAWSSAIASGERAATDAAKKVWESQFLYPGEDKDPEHQMVLGGIVAFARLLDCAPTERGLDGRPAPAGTSRFAVLARRVWQPLQDHESVVR
ncbi:MAG: exodeoxyribonuclease V subunit gamma [Acidimicrobiales bacterium]